MKNNSCCRKKVCSKCIAYALVALSRCGFNSYKYKKYLKVVPLHCMDPCKQMYLMHLRSLNKDTLGGAKVSRLSKTKNANKR